LTAEVVIMNKYGVALATDSALTVMGGANYRTFRSGNKLFSLSPYYPVAVMFYGSPALCGIPWESLVKDYRQTLAKAAFRSVEEYAKGLLEHLARCSALRAPLTEESYLGIVEEYYRDVVLAMIRSATRSHFHQHGSLPPDTADEIAIAVVQTLHLEWNKRRPNRETCPNADEIRQYVTKKLYGKIMALQRRIFAGFDVLLRESILTDFAYNLATVHVPGYDPHTCSGLAVAGFGENEMFPSIYSYHVWGVLGHHLLYTPDPQGTKQVGDGSTAYVLPFAQPSGLERLLGRGPMWEQFLREFAKESQNGDYWATQDTDPVRPTLFGRVQRDTNLYTDDINRLMIDATRVLERTFVAPMNKAVANMPKEELAGMAELCVSLSSFLTGVHWQDGPESISGPVDVALVSKGDGFIWVKRKHYFNPGLNPRFAADYHEREKRRSRTTSKGGENRAE